MVEIDYSNEPFKQLEVQRLGIIHDGCDLGQEGFDTGLVSTPLLNIEITQNFDSQKIGP